MEDQAGNAIHLPPAERRNLLIALALHEKGKSALKKERYSEALLMFIEADGEYQSCTTSLLDSVDNWALLNLDIVWCYLCLKVIHLISELIAKIHYRVLSTAEHFPTARGRKASVHLREEL